MSDEGIICYDILHFEVPEETLKLLKARAMCIFM